MFSGKEVIWIIIAILIGGFVIGLSSKLEPSLIGLLWASIIILVSVIAKKIAAPFYSLKIEHKSWGWKRWGWYERSQFKKPIPLGIILPFFLSVLSLAIIKPLTLLQFDAENFTKKRVLRKRGTYRYSEINESDLAFTAAWGFWALIALAILCSFLKQPEISRYAIYYGIWNLIPFGNLDGTKIFFGSLTNWILLVIVYIISLVIVLI
ncbi:MAG: hypothetical protein PHH54_04080 [Candidatus Nanoarchaeia archaeon]|nr:hypothetical protein [Candidatus Nanoarchaeia archaeon]MDD5741138.1 hypothetical protein [Candidatus Nanoarchaeia archaeon]